jgi:hypothetical protein
LNLKSTGPPSTSPTSLMPTDETHCSSGQKNTPENIAETETR